MTTRYVFDLQSAYNAYWSAKTFREQQAAYHEILLFGGYDSFRSPSWRISLARWLRMLAFRVEGRRSDPISVREAQPDKKVDAVLRYLSERQRIAQH
jgi:hypothetical protein